MIAGYFYKLFVYLLAAAESVGSLFNAKLVKRRQGLKQLPETLRSITTQRKEAPLVWCHCSSLGEYEQAIPVLQYIKAHAKDPIFTVVSFYSASGFEYCKKNDWYDHLIYLPVDLKSNARYLVSQLNPTIVIWTKYDFWFHYFKLIHTLGIPLILFSSSFRKEQYFFSRYANELLNILKGINHIFVQDKASFELLKQYRFNQVQIAGDTRIDRVLSRKDDLNVDPLIKSFTNTQKTIILASTHDEDIDCINIVAKNITTEKLLIFPHEVDQTSILKLEQKLIIKSDRWSHGSQSGASILIVDTIGKLFDAYSLADMVYIGGGFGKSIHNILEPTVFGIPTVFGPNYGKFKEANELVDLNLVQVIGQTDELWTAIQSLDELEILRISEGLRSYYKEARGATQMVGNCIIASIDK